LRVPWLRDDRVAATTLADRIAARPGVIEVVVRPRTGGVLCRFDERRIGAAQLIAAVRRESGIAALSRRSAPLPAVVRAGGSRGSSVSRAFFDAFRGIDADVYAATAGRLDLGTLAGLGLLAAGAAEVMVTRQLPAPPWFSLAWWAFRTFTMFESSSPPPVPATRDELANRRARSARPAR
jgi:hypothetical protein